MLSTNDDNKSASSELFRTFTEYWDSQISIRVLGNTLTTDVQSTGTQALGTVHKDEEVGMNEEDREFVLDVLNYEMTEIFASLGYNTEGGKFVYAKKEEIDPAQQIDIITKLSALGLPLDHDYLYETFGVRKPENYDAIIEACLKADVEYGFVELDDCYGADPFDCLKRSYDYLTSLGLN